MKKLLYLAVIVAIALPAFTSCTKNDNEHKAGTIYHLSISDDLSDLCDIVATYRDADSTLKTSKMTDIEWKKMVMHKTYSFNTWLGYEFKLKPDVKLNKDVYEIFLSYEILNFADYSKNTDEGALNTIIACSIKRDQLEATIAELNTKGHPVISINYKPGQSKVVEGDYDDVSRFFKAYHHYDIDSATNALIENANKNANSIDDLTDTTTKN